MYEVKDFDVCICSDYRLHHDTDMFCRMCKKFKENGCKRFSLLLAAPDVPWPYSQEDYKDVPDPAIHKDHEPSRTGRRGINVS